MQVTHPAERVLKYGNSIILNMCLTSNPLGEQAGQVKWDGQDKQPLSLHNLQKTTLQTSSKHL